MRTNNTGQNRPDNFTKTLGFINLILEILIIYYLFIAKNNNNNTKNVKNYITQEKTLWLGGSWSVYQENYIDNIENFDFYPASGFNTQVHSMFIGAKIQRSKVGSSRKFNPYMQYPRTSNMIWDLTVNDMSVNIEEHSNEVIHSIIAVLIWNSCSGIFIEPINGNVSPSAHNYGKINLESTEIDNPVICNINHGKDWYYIFVLVNDYRDIKFVIKENGKKIYFNDNKNAFSERKASYEIIAIPYYSKTGSFTILAWSDANISNNAGFLLGVRKKEELKDVTIFKSIGKWDISPDKIAIRQTLMSQIIDDVGRLWRKWGGNYNIEVLPTSGYMMQDKLHLDHEKNTDTSYLHAQYVNTYLEN